MERFSEVLNVHHHYSIFLLIIVFPLLKYNNEQTNCIHLEKGNHKKTNNTAFDAFDGHSTWYHQWVGILLTEIFRHTCLQSRFYQIYPFSGQNRVNWGCRVGRAEGSILTLIIIF